MPEGVNILYVLKTIATNLTKIMPSSKPNKKKIFNDPVYGFVSIPDDLHFDIIEHPYFQRLRRIKQLGLTHLVYPGALHTRFQHSLGAMHLMQYAIGVLKSKGHDISASETQAASLAILMHDLGHAPYSHTLEQSIAHNIRHEELSLVFIRQLNTIFNGQLDMAIDIFTGRYPKMFLHQLVSSQLDMDRIDYLKRDSYFSGVSDGTISDERLISMLDVVDDKLVVEAKGIYSVEKFIIARRLMYWQVYLHKTVLSAEFMLKNIFRRARQLMQSGVALFASPALRFFLHQDLNISELENHEGAAGIFASLDDYDVFFSLKIWAGHPDKTLAFLSKSIVNRNLFKVELSNHEFEEEYISGIKNKIASEFKDCAHAADFLFIHETTSNNAYYPGNSSINIVFKNGKIMDISQASDQLNISMLARPVIKNFICYPKM
jgi:uncharacterized protein